MTTLQSLFHHLAIASTEYELRSVFLDTAGELFQSQAWGFTLLDQDFQIVETDKRGLPDSFVDCYNEVGIPKDPVMSSVIERHAPVHNHLVLSPENWKRSAIYQHVALRYGIEHIMMGPLVGGGHLVGKVYLMRNSQTMPFSTEDLSRLSALCTHLSVCLATLRASATAPDSGVVKCLTQRELQIAGLVAQGKRTAEISTTLGITQNSVKQALKRMFLKLDVSTRAEMVAQLQWVSISQRVGLFR
ncbi:GAF domain-containing protein [Microcoleus sp. FACHB-SPT15]|uniref:LuxR C-terminal-related transcriptional regulator n=1 Tax=Microcoleus sp. FACHB-SPT15 TaxID=2692830 RepID=UPI0017865F87|nr:LuxR C-terminal-related transcriptional regulator [Microcoleus sp. FACHB-SPT15]MBD1807548.1 GAF domain-containing protein [Microcoleus sp. FACHB-SPT15]